MWSPRAEEVVSGLIAQLPPEQLDPARTHAVRMNALPICWSLWADYYLRPNGKVVIVGADLEHPDVDTVDSSRLHVLSVLVSGTRRYPELRELLPTREVSAKDCLCRLRHQELFGPGKGICPGCGGVGWLPEDP